MHSICCEEMPKTSKKPTTTSAKKPAKPATKPAKAASSPPRGYEHGERASGARFRIPGRALTPELDLAFALGHGGGGIAPMNLMPDLELGKKPTWSWIDASRFPRNVILEYVTAKPRTMEPPPLEDTDAAQLVRKLVDSISLPWMFLGLEAIAGPSCVLAAMVEGIEAAKERQWDNGGWGALCGPLKGMMLRVPEPEAGAARDRLEAAWKKWHHLHGALTFDVLLHGREGIARSGYKYIATTKCYGRAPDNTEAPASTWELTLLDDESDFIAQQYEALWTAFNWKPQARMLSPASGRLLFLGGDRAMRTELRAVDSFPGTMQAEAFAACSDFGGALVKQMMTKLARPGSKVQKRAQAWLDANG